MDSVNDYISWCEEEKTYIASSLEGHVPLAVKGVPSVLESTPFVPLTLRPPARGL
jgi:hypothetical protein